MPKIWTKEVAVDTRMTEVYTIELTPENVIISMEANVPGYGNSYSCPKQDFIKGNAQAKSLIVQFFGKDVYAEVLTVANP